MLTCTCTCPGALSECSIRNDNNKRLISEHGAILPLVKMLRSQVLLVFLSQVRVSSSSIRGVDVCACVYVERVPDVESVDQDLSVQRLSSCALCNVCANHEVMGMSVRACVRVCARKGGREDGRERKESLHRPRLPCGHRPTWKLPVDTTRAHKGASVCVRSRVRARVHT